MVFRPTVLSDLNASYSTMAAHLADVRSFYEVIDARLASGEYGSVLRTATGRRVFSSIDSYWLPDDTLEGDDGPEPGSCPRYIWLPTWLGRFYVDSAVNQLAFVWIWFGVDDAFVADTDAPECWFGTVAMRERPFHGVVATAKQIWHFFRFEWTQEHESEGWLTGHLRRNATGCDLDESWSLRRIPLTELSSYYRIERFVVRPLVERYDCKDSIGMFNIKEGDP